MQNAGDSEQECDGVRLLYSIGVKHLGLSRGELVARLHRGPAYLERRAVLASPSDPSGALDGLSRCHPVLPDDQRSQADIPGTDEISMEGEATVLAHEEQPVLG